MLTVSDVSLRFSDRKLFDEVNINFTAGNTYGLIGANGAGKSTFLKILAGDIEPTTGHISLGPDERLSVLRQNHFDYEEERAIDVVIMGNERLYNIMKEKDAIYMKPDFSDEDGVRAAELESEFAELGGWEAESEASQLLQNLNIPEDLHYQNMSELANGDKVKVLLAKALFGKPDVLLLDEPTNDLDIATLTVLESFLQTFQGPVITVSHDRYFLDKVANKILAFENGHVREFFGNCTDYLDEKAFEENAVVQVKKEAQQKTEKEKTKKKRMSYFEKQEWEVIEDEIAKLEEDIESIEAQMQENASDYGKLAELQRSLDEANENLLEKYERYEYLSDLAE